MLPLKNVMNVLVCNPSIPEAETGRLLDPGYPWPHGEMSQSKTKNQLVRVLTVLQSSGVCLLSTELQVSAPTWVLVLSERSAY